MKKIIFFLGGVVGAQNLLLFCPCKIEYFPAGLAAPTLGKILIFYRSKISLILCGSHGYLVAFCSGHVTIHQEIDAWSVSSSFKAYTSNP